MTGNAALRSSKGPVVVSFDNPVVGRVTREFATREEADQRVEHYREKYGSFPGYTDAVIEEVH